MLITYLGFSATGVKPGVYFKVPANHLGCTGGGPQINPIPLQLGQGLHRDLDVEVCPGAADIHRYNYWDRKQGACVGLGGGGGFRRKATSRMQKAINICILALSHAKGRHGWLPGTTLLSAQGRDLTINPLEPHPLSRVSRGHTSVITGNTILLSLPLSTTAKPAGHLSCCPGPDHKSFVDSLPWAQRSPASYNTPARDTTLMKQRRHILEGLHACSGVRQLHGCHTALLKE